MKSQAEILSLMRRYKPTAQKKYGMTKLGISLLTLDMIQTELEQLLDCKVDLVRVRDNMNSLLRQRIIRDGIYV